MKIINLFLPVLFFLDCKESPYFINQNQDQNQTKSKKNLPKTILSTATTDFYQKLSEAAVSIIDPEVVYTPTYVNMTYPNGDVPEKTGVCTDVVIRTYRKLGIDLQKEVHEDMKAHFSLYPSQKKWGLKTTDTNIDHRRVPNLEIFFERKGEKLPLTQNPNDYKTGELVTWLLAGDKTPHIGILTHLKSTDGQRNLIVHNIGKGQVLEDCLFNWKIVGHFIYKK